jgi:hypothetical protein
MVRKSLRVAAHAAFALTAGSSCLGVEFVAPEEREPGSFASIEATFDHADSLDILVRINLDAGVDDNGRPRQLDIESVLVDGRPLDPVRVPQIGRYEFETIMRSGPGSEPAAIVVTLPGIAGEAGPLDVVVPVQRRAGPRDVYWNADDELVLPIHAPIPLEALFSRWQIDFVTACGSTRPVSFVGASTLPPDTVTVPRSLVGGDTGPLEACLEFDARISLEPADSPWSGSISLRALAVWTVRDPP